MDYKRIDKDGPYAPHYHGADAEDPVYRNTIARMFRSDFIEFFSRVHPAVPGLIYGPVAAWGLYAAFQAQPAALAALSVAAGGLVWTFTEYMLHRYVFHLAPKGPVSSFIYFQSHGIHHQYPDDFYRLLMVPPVSLPLAGLFYLGFRAVLPAAVLPGAFAGFILGYLAYDYIHFAVHHFKPPRAAWAEPIARWFKAARRRHLVHHFDDHHRGYGVSTGLWDHVFGTVAEK
ncbi:MAG: sterol desaturase family protein [Polyangiales bacterium]